MFECLIIQQLQPNSHDICHSVSANEGFIRFKGKLPGKNGRFYGIELTQGTGKHNGDYEGTHYFDCAEGQGIFIQKKHIVFKLNEKPNKSKKRKHSQKKSTKISPQSANEVGSQFVVKRKAGPNKRDKPKGWSAPKWANDVLQDDGTSFVSEKKAIRGKQIDLKNLYDKAGYLPFAQRNKFKSMGYTDAEIDSLVHSLQFRQSVNQSLKAINQRVRQSVCQHLKWLKSEWNLNGMSFDNRM